MTDKNLTEKAKARGKVSPNPGSMAGKTVESRPGWNHLFTIPFVVLYKITTAAGGCYKLEKLK